MNWTIGLMFSCPWRIEFGRQFEYWRLYQIGPLYALHHVERKPTSGGRP